MDRVVVLGREALDSNVEEPAGRRSVPLTRFVVATAFALAAVAYFILRNGGWVYDDNLILVLARTTGFSWQWLDQPIYQHWDPGMNATYSLMVHLFPFDYRWGLLAMLAVLFASILVFERVVGLIVGRGWVSLALSAWFGISILWTRQLQWWAAGVQELPTLLCDLICLYGFLRFHADRRNRWIVISTGALAVGLLFYEKPALMLVYLALLRALLLSDRLSLRRLPSALWAERRLWLSYVTVVVIWGIGYVSSGAYSAAQSGHVAIGEYLSYFRIMWINTLVPALAGFTLPAAHLSVVQTIAAAGLQFVLVCLLAVSVHRNRSAWRAWAFLAIIVVLDGGLVAHSRVALFGVGIGNDLRYLTDFAWLIPFALCFAFSRERGLRPHVNASTPRISFRAPTSVLPLGIAALLAVYSAGSVASAARIQALWGSVQARHWEDNVQRGFATLAHDYVKPVVADETVPFQIISYPFAPDNRLSQVLPLYAHGVQVDGPLDGALVTIDATGNVHRATTASSVGNGAITHLLRAHQLMIAGGTVSKPKGQMCVTAGTTQARIEGHLSATRGGSDPYYVELRYSTSQLFAMPVFEDTGHGYPDATSDRMLVTPYSHTSLAWLDAGLARRLEVILPPHATLCIRRMDVITLRPIGA